MSCRADRNNGFTLIELLIVIFIIGIVTSVALLSINYNKNKQSQNVAKEIVAQITFAQEQALLLPAVIGIKVEAQKLQFLKYVTIQQAGKEKKIWQPLTDNILNVLSVPAGLSIQGIFPSHHNAAAPDIIISSNGDITPFVLQIGASGSKAVYSVSTVENGSVIINNLNP